MHSPFQKEISGWLSATGFTVGTTADRRDLWWILNVTNSKGPQLVILGVDIQKWAESQGGEDLEKCYREAESIRSGHNQCIVLWEDYWVSKREIVQSRILALMGISQRIPGRLTVVKRVTQNNANGFLTKNHLQGAMPGKWRYGLFLPNRYYRIWTKQEELDHQTSEMLVALATFSHPRIFTIDGRPHRSFELVRFASLRGTSVVGGLDKLLNALARERHPDDIMTYADLEWSVGASYARLGFEVKDRKPPHLFYLDTGTMNRVSASYKLEAASYLPVYNMGSLKCVKTYVPYHDES